MGDSIRVAIVDDGVDNTHDDLKDALGNRRVLNGFPSLYGHGTHYYPSRFHGTACAGIIAASHNNIGIAGIAPNALIVPIRIQRGKNQYFSARRIQKAITKAWEEYHAQVLNIAWIGQNIDLFTEAFKKAMKQGRDGKGCVIVVASGNSGWTRVEYPADVDSVIAVGAVDRCGLRAGYSNGWTSSCDPWNNVGASSYGSKLSIVAPGSHIYTIDPKGTAGLLSGDYNPNFFGTSAACSHVSGVVALMLSVNPNLTHAQVKEIIEKTAQKVGGYDYTSNPLQHPNGTWHEQVGYGMVNAIRAIAESKIYGTEYTINGLPYMHLCNEYTYTLSGNVPEGYEIIWEVNPQMAIVSGQGTSVLVVRPIYPAMYNWLRAKICFEGEIIREEFMDNIVSTGSGYHLVIPYDSVLTQNALWNIERTLANTAIIDSGAVLTITSTIHCTDNARLIVRPGGKLVVDGGTLTSACPGEMWQGIEVVGDRTKQQHFQYQGIVELKNGATIENALCGIRTGLREDTVTFATTGGIIFASDATFLNNCRAVEINSYAYPVPGTAVTDYVSNFNRCSFTVDSNNLFAPNYTAFTEHVKLWDVKGVDFYGCTFENLTNGNTNKGRGIYADDAGVIVETYCTRPLYENECECPDTLATYGSFSGFNTAIEVNTTGNPYAVRVNETDFENNGTGVKINGNNYVTVINNNFNLQKIPRLSANQYGLYLDNCTGYWVEGNTFVKSSNSNYPTSTGIYVNNSGSATNSLYRNDFSHLYYGIYLSGKSGGLSMSCGSFDNNTYGIYIASGATVAHIQGSSSKGADISFPTVLTSSIYNANSKTIRYYYSVTGTHYPTNYVNITPVPTKNENTCSPTPCNAIPYPGPGPADGLAGEMTSDTYHTAVRAIMADSLLDLSALEQWHAAAQPIGDPYSLTETRFMMGYNEPFVADADDAELANYAEFHAMKVSLRGQYDNTDNQDNIDSQNSPMINWYALTPAQIAQLQTIAERNAGRASVMAKGVLCFFHGICYDDDSFVDDNVDNNDNNMETRSAKASPQDGETRLNVYPNPTDDLLFVELSGAGIQSAALFDLQGRVVTNAGVCDTPQRGTATMNLRSIPAGVYLLRVTDTEGREYHQKIVKR